MIASFLVIAMLQAGNIGDTSPFNEKYLSSHTQRIVKEEARLRWRCTFTTRSTSSKRRLLDLLARFFSSCSNIINSSVGAAASTFR
jgi:hypothetical protein